MRRGRTAREGGRERTLVLLEELLGEVLEVALREGDGRGDRELARTLTLELDVVAELASLALDLDVVDEELLVRSGVELRAQGGESAVRLDRNGQPEREGGEVGRTILSLAGPE